MIVDKLFAGPYYCRRQSHVPCAGAFALGLAHSVAFRPNATRKPGNVSASDLRANKLFLEREHTLSEFVLGASSNIPSDDEDYNWTYAIGQIWERDWSDPREDIYELDDGMEFD